ncbi:unnamed protein product [Clavelina lepadiformis]|uniref:G-protein coupled receptors family 1 profile domain-containing protein n=1 Tax=Clavelina lepadiformis TaxID=159417 RepID=A0ABP0GVL4_CLALP
MGVNTVIYIGLEIAVAVLVIAGNAAVCYVVLNSPLRKKVMYMFVTSLALADLCVGIIAIPFAILTKLGHPHNEPYACVAVLSLIMVPTQTSIFNLMAISVERYLAIRFPRMHYTKVTRKKAFITIIVIWITSCFIGLLPLLGWNNMSHFSNFPAHSINDKYQLSSHEVNQSRVFGTTVAVAVTEVSSIIQNISFVQCEFTKVMDPNYMLFNFTVCVLPPLLTSAILYFVIFLQLLRSKNISDTPLSKTPSPACGTPNMIHKIPPASKNSPLQLRYVQKSAVRGKTSQETHMADAGNMLKNNKLVAKPEVPLTNIMRSSPTGDVTNTMKTRVAEKRETSVRMKCEDKSTMVFCNESILNPTTEPKNAEENAAQSSKNKSSTAFKNEGVDEQELSDRLNKLSSIKSMLEVDNSLRVSFDDGQRKTLLDTSGSLTSTPVLMRSRTGTDLSIRTKKRHLALRQAKRKRDIHAATVLALIVLSFAICWMPIHIINSIARFDHDETIFLPAWLYNLAIVFSHLNSVINFFLFSWRLKLFRFHLKRILLKLPSCNC